MVSVWVPHWAAIAVSQNTPFPSLVTLQPTDVALGAAVEPCEAAVDFWQSTREFLKYLGTSWKAAVTVIAL